MIYLPDSGPWSVTLAFDLVNDNLSFDQILTWLEEQIGPPSETIEGIEEKLQSGDLGGYFVDDVADLRNDQMIAGAA
jgi:hypothetical protein